MSRSRLALGLAALFLLIPALPAAAGAPSCLGKPATMVGTAGPDVLNGGPGADVIVGLGGDDQLMGSGGNDRICAGGGHDFIDAAGGNDLVNGDSGNDTYFGGAGDDEMNGGKGQDQMLYERATGPVIVNLPIEFATGEGRDILIKTEGVLGSPFDDVIRGTGKAEFLMGFGGNDAIRTAGGADYATGGDGDDHIDMGKGFDLVDFFEAPGPVNADLGSGTVTGEGTDEISGVEMLSGSTFDDVLVGGPKADLFWGMDGDDSVSGGDGFDTMMYTNSPDPVTVDLVAGTATGEGSDSLDSMETIVGSHFDDTITGGPEGESLQGGPGNDTILGGGGDDYFEGDAGDDEMDGGSGEFDMVGHLDFSGPVNADLAAGTIMGEGNDTVTNINMVEGTPANDTLIGDGQDNLLFGHLGDDDITGGGGFDLVVFRSLTDGVRADLSTGQSTGEGTDSLSEIEGLLGSDGPDVLIGDDSSNMLMGYGDKDRLVGAGGDDYFQGGGGNDRIDGGAGSGDYADYFFSPKAMSVDLPSGEAIGEGADRLSGVENVGGSELGDLLVGDGAANYLAGEAGADVISGGAGDDGLLGGPGEDQIDGGAGSDECVGGENVSACEGANEPTEPPLTDFGRSGAEITKRHR